MDAKNTHWGDAEGSTLSPLSQVEELVEELPTMTVAGIAVVVVVVLLAIGIVFTLGVMLDCRQKKVLEKRLRRTKPRRRTGEMDVESEGAGIADQMEPSGTSVPPVVAAAASTAVVTLHTPSPSPYHERAIAIV